MKCFVKYENGHRAFYLEASQIGGVLKLGCCFSIQRHLNMSKPCIKIFSTVSGKRTLDGRCMCSLLNLRSGGWRSEKQAGKYVLPHVSGNKNLSQLPACSRPHITLSAPCGQCISHKYTKEENAARVWKKPFHRSGCSMRRADNNKSRSPTLGAIRMQYGGFSAISD